MNPDDFFPNNLRNPSDRELMNMRLTVRGENAPERTTPRPDLVDVFIERDYMSREDAEAYVKELQAQVMAGEDPEELLYEEGLEPDYLQDLLPF